MKARLRFAVKPFFNQPPDKLVCPGRLIGRGHDRDGWTMVFTITRQVSALVYEGDLKWLIGPSEQDFGKGVRFQLISNPDRKRPLEGKDKDRRDKLEEDRKAGKERDKAREAKEKKPDQEVTQPKDDKKDKRGKTPKGAGHGAGGPPGNGNGNGPPDNPGNGGGGGHPDHGNPNPKPHPKPFPQIPDDAFNGVVLAAGAFAAGELLG